MIVPNRLILTYYIILVGLVMCSAENLPAFLKLLSDGHQRVKEKEAVRWRRTAEAELQALNLTWGQASRLAKDRQEWRRLVDALCATGRLKD